MTVAASRVAKAAALLLCLAGTAAAPQSWDMRAFDNGAWFEAHVLAPDRAVTLHCGGASPAGRPLPQSDEPMTTPDYTMALTLGFAGLGRPAAATGGARGDIMVVADARGFLLPAAQWDLLSDAGWRQPLGMGDPLIAGLREAAAIAVDAGATRHAVYAAMGLRDALDRAIAFCDARWAATGRALPASARAVIAAVRQRGLEAATTADAASQPPTRAPAPTDDPNPLTRLDAAGSALLGEVNAHVQRACGPTPSRLAPGYALPGNLDGDGHADIVLVWDNVDCGGSQPRPFCGAAQCLVEAFLSSTHVRGARPEQIYASAARIVPASNGLDLLETTGRLATCSASADPAACTFYWGWSGGTFGRVR